MDKFSEITDEALELLFEDLGYPIVVEEIVQTSEPLDADGWTRPLREYRRVEKTKTGGHPALIIHGAQRARGQTRETIIVIDVGRHRYAYAPGTQHA